MFLYSLCTNMQIMTNYEHKNLPFLSHFKTILNGLNLQEVYEYCSSSISGQIMIYQWFPEWIKYCTGPKKYFLW